MAPSELLPLFNHTTSIFKDTITLFHYIVTSNHYPIEPCCYPSTIFLIAHYPLFT